MPCLALTTAMTLPMPGGLQSLMSGKVCAPDHLLQENASAVERRGRTPSLAQIVGVYVS